MLLRKQCFQIADRGQPEDDDTSYGVKGRSILLTLPDADPQILLCPEIQHTIDLGVSKQLLMLTFLGSARRSTISTFSRVSPNKLNEKLEEIKVCVLLLLSTLLS